MLEAKAGVLAKTRFLANMARELLTPLNAIIGCSEIIKLPNLMRWTTPDGIDVPSSGR